MGWNRLEAFCIRRLWTEISMAKEALTLKKLTTEIAICMIILFAVMILCALIGSQEISFEKIFTSDGDDGIGNIDRQIFFGVRIPRIILASIVGAALACSGVVLQAILRNPLADPYILGISSGAGLGAITAALSGVSWSFLGGSGMTAFSFVGAILTVWLVWWVGRFTGKSQVTSLLLAGVVVNAFFSAVIMFLTSIAKSNQLQSTIFWLMGNITEKSNSVLITACILVILGIFTLFTISQKLNVLTFGSDQAKSLGVNIKHVRMIAFAVSAFITAIAVSLSGLIGFAGLIVPHGVRLVFGPDHRKLLPLSAIIGAIFMVAADTVARTIIAPAQMPAGIITAITGGPFFLYLLARYSRKVSWLK